MKKFLTITIIAVIVIIFGLSLVLERNTKPSADTRIILEHTHKTYIAPSCFEESNPTNFLEESTLEKAQTLNYKPSSACTEEALIHKKDRLLISILKEIGIIKKESDEW